MNSGFRTLIARVTLRTAHQAAFWLTPTTEASNTRKVSTTIKTESNTHLLYWSKWPSSIAGMVQSF
jgi:hypothetical protein